jgi:hypothetical protein
LRVPKTSSALVAAIPIAGAYGGARAGSSDRTSAMLYALRYARMGGGCVCGDWPTLV